MAKGVRTTLWLSMLAAAVMAGPAAAERAADPPADRIVGAPVWLDGVRYGAVRSLLLGPDGRIAAVVVEPAAPTSIPYAVEWEGVRIGPDGSVIVLQDSGVELATGEKR